MKYKKTLLASKLYIPMGLLLITIPFLINDWVPIPDFVRGCLMGFGIGLEIVGLIMLSKNRKADTSI